MGLYVDIFVIFLWNLPRAHELVAINFTSLFTHVFIVVLK
jgi:hypothetical protein